MSAEATGWVFKQSPYKGALFTLHLAIADIVNDTHGNELWASVATLAEKARLGDRIVRKGLLQMVDDGLLELLSSTNGQARRFRFVIPDRGTQDRAAPHATPAPHASTAALSTESAAPGAGTAARRAPISQVTQVEPKQEPKTPSTALARSVVEGCFDEFWSVYPKRKAKGEARTAFAKALKRTDAQSIIEGAIAYRDDPTRKDEYTKHPATWLNADCWTDEHAPPRRTHSKGTARVMAYLERKQTGPERLELSS